MTKREVTLKGGPHDGRVIELSGQFTTLHTVEVICNTAQPFPAPLKWWERLIGRNAPYVPPFEPFTFVQHTYDAGTGKYLGPFIPKELE